jgi:type I restriction enzyme R subunit
MSYDEDTLVEQPAIRLFESMGWQSCNCYDEILGIEGGSIGREERSDVVLVRRLRDAIEKLNPGLDELLITEVIAELNRDRSLMSDIAANEEIYGYLKEGV